MQSVSIPADLERFRNWNNRFGRDRQTNEMQTKSKRAAFGRRFLLQLLC